MDPQNLREYEWVRRVEWLPTLALLAVAFLWPRRSNKKAAGNPDGLA
ncbi:MAG: hypothetical protein HC802_12865 [Caldilineaceae bacterium]|nr:hypothetical protein [Caldilineaceae bacterium]